MAHSWTEDWLRKVASWQAVKEAKRLFESGAVDLAEAGESMCRGRVGKGRGARRVLVRVLGPHDVEAKCGCPENAASGAVCAHAAALVVAAIHGGSKPQAKPERAGEKWGAKAPSASPPDRASEPAAPLFVEFPPGWLNGLERGKLCARVSKSGKPEERPGGGSRAEAGEADRRLAKQWLRRVRGAEAILRPDDARAAAFLADLAGHPRIRAAERAGRADSIEVLAAGVRVPAQVEFDAATDTLEIRWRPAAPKRDRLFVLGGTPWLWAADEQRLASPGIAVPAWGETEWRALAAGKPVRMPLGQVAPVLETLREMFAAQPGSWLDSVRVVPVPPRIRLVLDGSLRSLDARVFALYPEAAPEPLALAPPEPDHGRAGESPAGETPLGWNDERTSLLRRDPAAGQAALKRLFLAGFRPLDEPGAWRLSGEDEIAAFVAEALPLCRKDKWEIQESPKWRQAAKRIRVVRPEIETLPSPEPDQVAFRIRYVARDESGHSEEIPPDQIRRLLATRRTRIPRRDGGALVLPEGELEALERSFETMAPTREGGGFVADSLHGPLLWGLREKYAQQTGDESFTKSELEEKRKRIFVSIESFNQALQSKGIHLRDYQVSGIRWLAERAGMWGAALLADDMGLGKTLQVIGVLRVLGEVGGLDGPTLVVCPTSVLGHWREELEKFWPGARVLTLHGPMREAAFGDIDSGACDVALTSYGTLERDRALHLRRSYGAVVLDEASAIRNPSTDAARSVCKLDAGVRLALTGTPIENSVGDLWSIFRFLRPGYLGNREDFKRRYEEGEGQASRRLAPQTNLRELRMRVAPLILRRTKERVASELPPRIEINEWCELNPGQKRLYESILHEHRRRTLGQRSEAAERMEMLTVLLRLRQVCCDPGLLAIEGNDSDGGSERTLETIGSAKVGRCLELVREAVMENRKVLIFSQFAKMLRRLRDRISAELSVDSALLCGATRDRQAEIDRFKRADGPSVFLISLKAGGYGLNLTEADVVIHFDPWWNPAAEAQATDRAHRIGQTHPVNVYRLLTAGTVEAHVLRLQERKRSLVGATLDEESLGQARGIATGELEDLLRG